MHLGLRVKLKLTLGINYMKNTQKISLWSSATVALQAPLATFKTQESTKGGI